MTRPRRINQGPWKKNSTMGFTMNNTRIAIIHEFKGNMIKELRLANGVIGIQKGPVTESNVTIKGVLIDTQNKCD